MTDAAKKKVGFPVEKIIRPAAKGEERLPTQVSLPLLAKLLGISVTAAREHADRRLLVKGNPGMFILEASVQSYTAHLRKLADGKFGSASAISDATVSRGKLAEAQADLAEVKAARMRGDLVSAEDVSRHWCGKMKVFRARILSAADKFPHLLADDRDTLTAELKSALFELSNGG